MKIVLFPFPIVEKEKSKKEKKINKNKVKEGTWWLKLQNPEVGLATFTQNNQISEKKKKTLPLSPNKINPFKAKHQIHEEKENEHLKK